MNVILIGPPGCGKGTQAQEICHKYNLFYVSTGNLIREEIEKKTSLGLFVKNKIQRGELVDDDTVISLVKKKIQSTKKGILFDGFPRTLAQAKELESFCTIDYVIDIQVSDEQVISRISHRYMVEKDHSQFTFTSKAQAQKFVDTHGGHIFHRKDDTPKVISQRLEIYHTQTQPLIEYYGKKHLLFIVNGEKAIPQVTKDIFQILHRRK